MRLTCTRHFFGVRMTDADKKAWQAIAEIFDNSAKREKRRKEVKDEWDEQDQKQYDRERAKDRAR